MLKVSSPELGINLKYNDHPDVDEQEMQLQQQLLAVARQQDKAAYTLLFNYFAPRIHRFGLQRLQIEAQAMELVQETMLLVWRKASLFDSDKGKASGWIFTVMRNVCFDMLRKKQRNKEDDVSEDLWPLFSEEDTSLNKDHLFSRHLLEHINSLPMQQKEVVEAIYLQDMSQQELANHLDLPLGTVKSRLRLAISKLKLKLESAND
ncbi:sigma-70 family RNA polymerase sigma factor [Psychromonas sp. MME2]|uniref:sigma-70 family RNA polymerase sigma factor n=1 Tax=unclassified Psychromonas TaxID=2614957 RepID=UPI00339CE977